MSLITRVQKEVLTYWPPIESGANQFGELTYGPPEEVKCRWDDRIQEIILDDQTRVISRVEVISEKRLEVGGIIVRSPLDSVTGLANPKDNKNAFEILRSSETRRLNYREALYEAWA